MNSVYELEAQNLQDSWSILYFKLVEIIFTQSERGEEITRKAVRDYGKFIGEFERMAHIKKGIKINLQNFYTIPQIRFEDPRLFENQQRLNEQVVVTDVIRCPFASCARMYEVEKKAKLFCEEFTAACIGAYTGYVAQVNISEVLTEPRNNRCRVASYYRPGNIGVDAYQEYFSSFSEFETTCIDIDQKLDDAKTKWNICADFLIQAFEKNHAGLIRNHKDAIAESIASFLEQRAKSMEQKLEWGFVERNCALSINDYPDFKEALSDVLALE